MAQTIRAKFEVKKPAPQPPMPKANDYSIYAVKVYLKRKEEGYRRAHLKSIVRTQNYSEVQPAIEEALKDFLEEHKAYIEKVDIRKLECDFFIYDTKSLFKNK